MWCSSRSAERLTCLRGMAQAPCPDRILPLNQAIISTYAIPVSRSHGPQGLAWPLRRTEVPFSTPDNQ